jgi:hypothetical protein
MAARHLGAALLRAGRADEALDALRGNMSSARMDFAGVAMGPLAEDGSLAAALEEAAQVCINAHDMSAEWIRALGGVAERSGEARHWAALDALDGLQQGGEAAREELEIARQQAGNRGFGQVVERLERAWAARSGRPSAMAIACRDTTICRLSAAVPLRDGTSVVRVDRGPRPFWRAGLRDTRGRQSARRQSRWAVLERIGTSSVPRGMAECQSLVTLARGTESDRK